MLRLNKRFYQAAGVEREGGEFRVVLDGRPLRTPAGARLALPTRALAEAVAAEWEAQAETIRPETMPLTRLVSTALDRVAGSRAGVVANLVEYGGTDLVCYRADAPPELVARQAVVWEPLLGWTAERFGARLRASEGVIPILQPEEALAAFHRALAEYDDLTLTILATVVQAAGSLVIGLALVEGRLDADRAWEASLLDEHDQAERWGRDAEAERRRDGLRQELRAAADCLALMRHHGGGGEE